VHEVLSRGLRDQRVVGRYGGLTGSPDESGSHSREQGLAQAGNRRVRRGKHLGVEPVGLGAAVLARHRDTAGMDHIGRDAARPQPRSRRGRPRRPPRYG
jgi:hypothetical protein